MSQLSIPVTDAFDEPASRQSLEVELTPRQIEWLERQADERSLSVDHVLRALITAQIRGSDAEPPPPVRSDDGTPPASDADPAPERTDAPPNDEDDGSTSLVESLRSASERLQDLTEEDEESAASDRSDTLARLTARRDATDEDADAVVLENRGPSMFDLVEEEE
jgi:hypothetical protein